jgi:hypothetical protein
MFDKYFANQPGKECAQHLIKKSQDWYRSTQSNAYIDKVKRSWQAYHGIFYEDSHAISYGGEQGELANIPINHYSNIATNMHVMVTASRPSFQARARNTDKKSLVQAKLASGILDFYLREKRLERALKTAVEYAIVLGTGYIKLEWNSTKGEIYQTIDPDPNEIAYYDDNGVAYDENDREIKPFPVYEGDVEFKNLSPLDVVFDCTKENPELHDWVICRTFLNKFDLAEKYPEFEAEILASETKDRLDSKNIGANSNEETEDIPVYEFFHKKTESVMDGRYMIYIADGTVLVDTVMPYRQLPVYRIAPRTILGTPFGYSPMFDLLPIQDAVNAIYSIILTNQTTFGVQNILNPRGNDVKLSQIQSGLNFIEYNAQVGKPESLNLTNTPSELFNYLQKLEQAMEYISGVNPVVRGQVQGLTNLRSGNSMALLQSQALQFISGLQQSYVQLQEDVGTGVVQLLQDFAKVPRVAAIAGVRNTTKMVDFSSDHIKDIVRITVDVGNALMSSTAGRTEIAQNLMQMGLIKSPEKYLMVLNTGSLDYFQEGEFDEQIVIKSENEALLDGELPIAIFTDDHALHIKIHREVLADVQLRKDADLVDRTLAHIQEHVNLLKTVDPNLLMLIQQQPIQEQQPMPNNAPMMQDPVDPNAMDNGTLPQPAEPPIEGMPTTPQQGIANQA